MHHHTELSFVDEFRWVSPLHYLKNGRQNAVLLWCMLQEGRHFHTTTAPSYCIPASYYYLSVTLQPMSNIVVNLQDNRAVFRIFIALLRFSFESPSYHHQTEEWRDRRSTWQIWERRKLPLLFWKEYIKESCHSDDLSVGTMIILK